MPICASIGGMRIARIGLGIICTIVVVMIEVRSDQATGIFATWFRDGGLSSIANWLDGPVVSHIVPTYAVWVLLSVAIICFCGPLFWLFLKRMFGTRTKMEPAAVIIRDWKTPIEAIEAFGNKSIRLERDRLEQEAAKIRAAASEAELAISKIDKSYPEGGVSPPRAPPDVLDDRAQWHEKLRAAVFAHDAAKQAFDEAARQLLRQVVQQLAQGELIAKGFLISDGLGETEIPQSEWRMLELDPCTAAASRCGNTRFTGVLIGKPEDSK